MQQEIPADYKPNPFEKIKQEDIEEYIQLEFLADTHPEFMTEHLQRKHNRLRRKMIRDYPDDFVC